MRCFENYRVSALVRCWRLVMLVVAYWFTGGNIAWAQNRCLNPGAATVGSFAINRTKACVNSPVSVTTTLAGATNITYTFQYDGVGAPGRAGFPDPGTLPNQASPNTNYTYTAPGSYSILQVGSASGTGSIKCETVTILPNEQINFTAQACFGGQVALSFNLNANTSQYDQIRINWGDGSAETPFMAQIKSGNPVVHTYTSGTPKTIRVQGLYDAITLPQQDCITLESSITVNPTLTTAVAPIVSNLTTVDANTLSMRVQGPPNTDIQIWQKDASGAYQNTGRTARDGQVISINTNTSQSQCFQVRTTSTCPIPAQTDDYCSLVLNAQPGSKQVNVTWQPYTGTTTGSFQWRLTRDKFPYPVPGATNKATSSYTDQNGIECGKNYCYQLEARVGAATITSNSVCVTGSNDEQPQPMTDIRLSVEPDGAVRYQALQPNVGATTNFTMIVTRAESPNGPFTTVGQTTNEAIFIDRSAKAGDKSYCYQVVYHNECGQESAPSAPACTIWLTSKSPGALDWTADSPFGPVAVVRYEVEYIDRATGNVIRRQPVGNNTHFEPDRNDPDASTYRFVIVATAANGFSSRSNPYEINLEADIFAPTAFTPNGDAINNRFQAKGYFSDNYRLTIFNRWGEVLYSTTSFRDDDGWDGTINGQPAPNGSYPWRVEVTDRSGKQTVKIGSVLLIR